MYHELRERGTRPRACVIGHPVAHSRSPLLHGYWLKTLGIAGAYERADVPEPDFANFLRDLRRQGYVGANITVPHKEAAFRLVDRRDEAAQAIGAVNTVWYENDRLVGGNTDAYGFIAHLDASIPRWHETTHRAVVLGAGGAARAVVHALLARGIEIALVNRTLARAQDLAAHFSQWISAESFAQLPQRLGRGDLVVNTTSLGMIDKPALELDLAPLKPAAIVYDIVYVPLETEFLRAARARGHRTVDGLGMLLHQAVPGFARWFGVTPSVTPELKSLIESDIHAKTGLAGH
ncbi:MAG: shikimate dehydrogenase [Xanthobacteraceae bacterium]